MTIEPHRIAGLFYNTPLLLTEASARTISAVILSRFDMRRGGGGENDAGKSFHAFDGTRKADGSVELHSPRASRFVGEYRTGPDGRPTPYRVTADGTAIITVVGELVHRGAWIGASSGLVSYEGIKHQISTALRDPQVSAILIDLETPGGEAVGAFETAALIRRAREFKPVIAAVNGMAASAGYAIASGASRIVSIPTGISGSIGVVMMHLDVSAYLEDAGVKPTLIFAGAHKVDGNPYEPLPKGVRDRFQAQVDDFMSKFVQTVTAGRKGLSDQQVRATKADVFMGDEALRLGLVDEVGTFEDLVGALASPSSRSTLISAAAAHGSSPSMTTKVQPPASPTALTEAAPPAPAASPPATVEQPQAEPAPPAASAEPASPPAPIVTIADAVSSIQPPVAPTAAAPPAPVQPAGGTVSREEAAQIVAIAAQAARLGVNVDAAKAIATGISPNALREQVLTTAASRDEASTVIATSTAPPRTPGPGQSAAPSGLVAAATAAAAKMQKSA